MSLKDQINQDLKSAMKEKDSTKLVGLFAKEAELNEEIQLFFPTKLLAQILNTELTRNNALVELHTSPCRNSDRLLNTGIFLLLKAYIENSNSIPMYVLSKGAQDL